MLEVDRFDPGRPNKDRTGATPTSLITGDIAVKTQVRNGYPHKVFLCTWYGVVSCEVVPK